MKHLQMDSPAGEMTIAEENGAITGIWFQDHRYLPPAAALGTRVEAGEDALLDDAAAQLRAYLAGERAEFDLPLAPAGTEKQRRVWEVVSSIPAGNTMTYGQIAAEIGSPKGARFVGQAVGRNPISVVIPCHRVVGSDSSMTGYACGIERKTYLLDLEGWKPEAE